MSKIELLVEIQNFVKNRTLFQKFKILSKIEFFVKINRIFVKNRTFWQKIQNVLEKQTFFQQFKILSKTEPFVKKFKMFSKNKLFFNNSKFFRKPNLLSKMQNFVTNRIFRQKFKIIVRISSKNTITGQNSALTLPDLKVICYCVGFLSVPVG